MIRDALKEKNRINYISHREARLRYAKEYREINRDVVRAAKKRYYLENKKSVKGKMRANYLANREQRLKYACEYRMLHPRTEADRIADIARRKRWRETHTEECRKSWRERAMRYRLAHPEKTRGYRKSYEKKNEDRIRARMKAWRDKNSGVLAAHALKRRNTAIKAIPPWIKMEQIQSFYEDAKQKTLETGIEHHVDHIWPIQGNGFVGLHVPWNLQVITAAQNISKGNRTPQ